MLQKRQQRIAQTFRTVVAAERWKAQLKHHGQTFRQIHAALFATVQILQHKMPHLGLCVEQQELETLSRDHRIPIAFVALHKIGVQQYSHRVRRYCFTVRALSGTSANHIMKHTSPAGHCIIVEEWNVAGLRVRVQYVAHRPRTTTGREFDDKQTNTEDRIVCLTRRAMQFSDSFWMFPRVPMRAGRQEWQPISIRPSHPKWQWQPNALYEKTEKRQIKTGRRIAETKRTNLA